VQPAIRFRNPDDGVVAWDDGVKGRIEFANSELDDLVIARGDGTPTYNFCVVVDDWDMGITHVIRGDDHVNNTPRQINIFRALGAPPPHFAHVPTVLGEDGAKLSKRHGAVGVMEYEAAGYLPEAMINFLARIGWAHGDAEVFTRDELVAWFDLPGISPAPSRFNAAKLNWVNQEHMKRMAGPELGQRLVPYLKRTGLDPAGGPDAGAVAVLLRDRADTLVAMADAAWYFYATPALSSEQIAQQVTSANRPALEALHAQFATIDWTRETLGTTIKATAATFGLKPPQLMMPLRLLVAGTLQTPAIDAVLALLGRDTVHARMTAGLAASVG
jgi:glutamyl-tRNA synthetase